MKKKTIFSMPSLYRDEFRVTGYQFGTSKKDACIVGAFRGNEIQQLYICSQLVKRLKELEAAGNLTSGKGIMVIPCVNPFSINVGKRFWSTDNTDINRMFPGYNLGETTQRIAGGVFEAIQDYSYGIQFASFYMSGDFQPHVRIMQTGMENIKMAQDFGLHYTVIREPRPYDTTTLNYNWQLWETNAFSLYTADTEQIDEETAVLGVKSVLNFLAKRKLIKLEDSDRFEPCPSTIINEKDLITISTNCAGIFRIKKGTPGAIVKQGDLLVEILHPYEGKVVKKITAPKDGTVFFVNDKPMILAHTVAFKIL